jgi:predicted RND superfamily exporter protein
MQQQTQQQTKPQNRLFKMVEYAVHKPKVIIRSTLIMTLLMCLFLPFASIDVDPENMLAADEPDRVFHNHMKKQMDINDLIVIGVENPNHPSGVFNPKSLNQIFEFSNYLKTIRWDNQENPQLKEGIITHNILSPNQVDAIIAGEPGVIAFERLMGAPITTQQQAETIKQRALDNPFLAGTMISNDQKSLALYLPISSKSVSAKIYKQINTHIESQQSDVNYHITGLPLAEDVFGIDMFIQMAISAPLAMIFIFILILYFFRNARVGASALMVAMASVLITMGAFVAFGNTIHIMSSMIAIFLMPIAVLDAIHILSMFFDKYKNEAQRKDTLLEVMSSLFKPMLNTSLTSAAGFFSLYLAPIPPIQVFGIFVGVGILIAWFLSMTLIPAYIMLLKPEQLKNFGSNNESKSDGESNFLSNLLQSLGQFSYKYSKTLLLAILATFAASIYGIGFIKVNDNPMKWLHPTHPIRIADNFINEEFGGNYLVYLSLSSASSSKNSTLENLSLQLDKSETNQAVAKTKEKISELIDLKIADSEKINRLWKYTHSQIQSAEESASQDMEDELGDIFAEDEDETDEKANKDWLLIQKLISDLRSGQQLFKRPDVLRYIAELQLHISKQELVGKSNSLADLVKKLNKELYNSDPNKYIIPDSADQVSDVLTTFENSHEPFRLWHAVTQDFTTTNMWFQVKSGDNQDINHIINQVDDYMANSPPPVLLEHKFFGLSFINTVWQKKMVSGMSSALIGSIVVVLIMMILLFRSVLWGLISVIPLSVTMAMIYGVIGIMGKDYDMPVAVLSALALGLSVDFAIHFLTHAKEQIEETGSWKQALVDIYKEPARAIYRNIIIIAIGFTPLLLAALVPYQTVGMLMATIMLVSGFATLIILPAVLKQLETFLFKKTKHN